MDFSFYSYKVTRDFGFAPNPFYDYCTLACCKPKIRVKATPGDWILGTGSVELENLYHLIYLMKVTEVLSFQEYWDDNRYINKKPNTKGDIFQMHGDNIYHQVNGNWIQEDSQHSFEGGMFNEENFNRDMNGKNVLISDHFYYFGSDHFMVPEEYRSLCCNEKQREHLKISDEKLVNDFLNYIDDNYLKGGSGMPISWSIYNLPEYNQLTLF